MLDSSNFSFLLFEEGWCANHQKVPLRSHEKSLETIASRAFPAIMERSKVCRGAGVIRVFYRSSR